MNVLVLLVYVWILVNHWDNAPSMPLVFVPHTWRPSIHHMIDVQDCVHGSQPAQNSKWNCTRLLCKEWNLYRHRIKQIKQRMITFRFDSHCDVRVMSNCPFLRSRSDKTGMDHVSECCSARWFSDRAGRVISFQVVQSAVWGFGRRNGLHLGEGSELRIRRTECIVLCLDNVSFMEFLWQR